MKAEFSDFETVNDLITGTIVITNNIQYNNIEAEKVIIEENVTARLFGKITDKLVLKPGATLYLHGSIYGNVENKGGVLNIYNI
ncbi:MAG: hypothetical protein K0S44_1165 [Bacteroidetes bacterium]|jgi:hypothetical protein|nr:hypothetical protein [Bacteroidota bacterium]